MIRQVVRLRTFLSRVVNWCLGIIGYALVRTTTTSHHVALRRIEHLGRTYAYENVVILDAYAPWAVDDEFQSIWALIERNTLVDILRGYELYQVVRESADLPGDILEVGVWRGASAAILAAAARRWMPEARIWLCDTFTGVVKAGEHDSHYTGGEHADTTVGMVESLLGRMGVTKAQILVGVFPDETGAEIANQQIALCHIDVDVYQSAADIVAWLAPRMPCGGILVFDDYGVSSCKGITRLVDELRESGTWRYFYNVNKHAILIKRSSPSLS